MASSTAPFPLNRCVNCAVRFQRNVQRQLLAETGENVHQLVCERISRELNPLDAVCKNCLVLLQQNAQTSHTTRRFGYRNICIPCGSSILGTDQTHGVSDGSAEINIILQWIPQHQLKKKCLMVVRLEQVCMACWLKACRTVRRHRQQDDNRPQPPVAPLEMADNSNIPQPPPMPAPTEPTISRTVPHITLFNYKHAANNVKKVNVT